MICTLHDCSIRIVMFQLLPTARFSDGFPTLPATQVPYTVEVCVCVIVCVGGGRGRVFEFEQRAEMLLCSSRAVFTKWSSRHYGSMADSPVLLQAYLSLKPGPKGYKIHYATWSVRCGLCLVVQHGSVSS